MALVTSKALTAPAGLGQTLHLVNFLAEHKHVQSRLWGVQSLCPAPQSRAPAALQAGKVSFHLGPSLLPP